MTRHAHGLRLRLRCRLMLVLLLLLIWLLFGRLHRYIFLSLPGGRWQNRARILRPGGGSSNVLNEIIRISPASAPSWLRIREHRKRGSCLARRSASGRNHSRSSNSRRCRRCCRRRVRSSSSRSSGRLLRYRRFGRFWVPVETFSLQSGHRIMR